MYSTMLFNVVPVDGRSPGFDYFGIALTMAGGRNVWMGNDMGTGALARLNAEPEVARALRTLEFLSITSERTGWDEEFYGGLLGSLAHMHGVARAMQQWVKGSSVTPHSVADRYLTIAHSLDVGRFDPDKERPDPWAGHGLDSHASSALSLVAELVAGTDVAPGAEGPGAVWTREFLAVPATATGSFTGGGMNSWLMLLLGIPLVFVFAVLVWAVNRGRVVRASRRLRRG